MAMLVGVAASADTTDVSLQYMYADDLDHGLGIGLRYSLAVTEQLCLDGRLGYMHFPDSDMDMVPLEAAARGYFLREGEAVRPYAGLGIGYYFLDANRGDADDDFGWTILGGLEMETRHAFNVITELRWLWLEADVDDTYAAYERTGSSIEVGGLGLNVGLLWWW